METPLRDMQGTGVEKLALFERLKAAGLALGKRIAQARGACTLHGGRGAVGQCATTTRARREPAPVSFHLHCRRRRENRHTPARVLKPCRRSHPL